MAREAYDIGCHQKEGVFHCAVQLGLGASCLLFLSATQSQFFAFLLFAAVASAYSYRYFRRRPCAGRHLLFFAAAKKSRQKKAAFEPPVPARAAPRHAVVDLLRSDVRTL